MNAQPISTYFPLEAAVPLDANATSLQPATPASLTTLSTSELQLSTPHSASLLFIDPAVAEYQTLVNAVTPSTEVHVLDAAQDAIAQITQELSGRRDISSLHIVSHGDAGLLQLGTQGLTLNNLTTYASQIQSWAGALTDNADILLYGCNIAKGELGHAFVQILSQLTQADVAASTDITGYGSNWVLEFQQGSIEATVPFNLSALDGYHNTLIGSDFDNNGSKDLVMYDYSTGAMALQLMNGATIINTINLGALGSGWQLADIADFDGNSYMDLVWHNVSTGETALCLMNGTTMFATIALPDIPDDSTWRIVGVKDFDLNGTPDILWRSSEEEATGLWLMTGVAVTGTQLLPYRSRDWVVSGVADVNNNGTPDILWRNPLTGENQWWLTSGTNVVGTIALPTLNSQWVAHEVADWNNDTFTDILWRNYYTGATEIWTLNNGYYTGAASVTVPGNGAGWTILDSRDLDNNGTPDMIVRNYVTGQNAFWMMNGTNYMGTIAAGAIGGLLDMVAA